MDESAAVGIRGRRTDPGRLLLDWARCGSFGVKALRAAITSGPVSIGLFISSNKKGILQCERPGDLILFGRVHKVGKGGSAGAHRAMLRVLQWLFRKAAGRLTVYVWGYSDISLLGADMTSRFSRVFRLETGLLGLGPAEQDEVFSYVSDSLAPYFDGRVPTDLEGLLQAYRSGSWRDDPRERHFVESMKRVRLQKYSSISGSLDVSVSPSDVVIAGQVTGDMAWQGTETAVRDNVELVAAAVRRFPDRRLLFKAHPFNPLADAEERRIRRDYPDVVILSPQAAFADVVSTRPTVVVCTSGAGFEALVAGCRVVCFGAAFYTGWGATDDEIRLPRRTNLLEPDDILFVVGYLYCRYGRRTADGTAISISAQDFVERMTEVRSN